MSYLVKLILELVCSGENQCHLIPEGLHLLLVLRRERAPQLILLCLLLLKTLLVLAHL